MPSLRPLLLLLFAAAVISSANAVVNCHACDSNLDGACITKEGLKNVPTTKPKPGQQCYSALYSLHDGGCNHAYHVVRGADKIMPESRVAIDFILCNTTLCNDHIFSGANFSMMPAAWATVLCLLVSALWRSC